MRAIVAAAFAATALITLPAAPVSAEAPGERDRCPGPVVGGWYDESERSVRVTLPATGCASREMSRFPLSVRVERSDFAGTQGADRTALCGPFRADVEDGAGYSCHAEVVLAYPGEEESDYTTTITYPGPERIETVTFTSMCVSNEAKAECEDGAQVLTGHDDGEAWPLVRDMRSTV